MYRLNPPDENRLEELDRLIEEEDGRRRKEIRREAAREFVEWAFGFFPKKKLTVRQAISAFLYKEFGLRGKYCNTCGKWRAASEFTSNKSQKDGLNWRCQPCDRQYKNTHYRLNAERFRERERGYYDNVVAIKRGRKRKYNKCPKNLKAVS